MSVTNHRNQEPDSVHHLISQIAHQVRFLNDIERDDFLARVMRDAEFCGIRMLGWGIMSTHFHLLVYLPPREYVSDEEVARRVALLNSDDLMLAYEGCPNMRELAALRTRMGNIGMFMKMVKQGFTMAYNMLNEHKGTMWSAPYTDKLVKKTTADMAYRLAYVNLNPYKAGMCETYEDYKWTSFAAAKKGDPYALKGLRFVYNPPSEPSAESEDEIVRTDRSDPLVQPEFRDDLSGENRTDRSDLSVRKELSDEELIAMAEGDMDAQMAEDRKRRAEEVWRRRFVGDGGYVDPKTSEALVAQVAAQMETLRTEEFRKDLAKKLANDKCDDELRVVQAMAVDPTATTRTLADILKISESGIKRISLALQKVGVIVREGTRRCGRWRIVFRPAA